mmetsp:Transcript_10398/g.16626  ORF Transcript_10398/g.16626 Transcript_10398/m.16626 type:complete len:228 (+) Transcript_10398:462-1145(+)
MHPTGETHPMAQVQSYLRFAKTKREENAREVDLTFDDVRHYKLQDAVYTQGEVSAMVDEVNLEVKSTLEKELVNNTYVTGAMLKMLFEQAEEAGCVLTIDTNKLENMKLLEDVKATEKVALSRPAADFARSATQGQKLGKLPPGLPPMGMQIRGGNERLEREIADLRDKYVKLQGQRQSGIMDKVSSELHGHNKALLRSSSPTPWVRAVDGFAHSSDSVVSFDMMVH